MKLEDQCCHFLDDICEGLAKRSRIRYRMALNDVVAMLGSRDPNSLTTPDIRAWIDRELVKLSPKTTKFHLMVFLRYIRWLSDRGMIAPDKEEIFAPRKLQRLNIINPPKHAILEEEHEALLAEIRRGQCYPWWLTACLMAWHLGLRVSDVAMSRWTNVDLTRGIYTECPQKTRRLGKMVTIPMDPQLRDWLATLQERPYYPSPFIIPDMMGYYTVNPSKLNHQFTKITTAAKVNPLTTFHSYRHAFVSRLLDAGIEPIVIASMTGQTVKQIEEYAHISIEAKARALRLAREHAQADRIQRNSQTA